MRIRMTFANTNVKEMAAKDEELVANVKDMAAKDKDLEELRAQLMRLEGVPPTGKD